MESVTVSHSQEEMERKNKTDGELEGSGGFNKSIFKLEYWIECETVLALLTVISVYLFVCILWYTATKKTSSRDASRKQGKQLYMMLVVASGFTVLRIASDHAVSFLSSKSDAFCIGTMAVSTVLYALALLSVYVFLWLRQSIFYASPVLSKVLNKGVTIASWSTLVVMLLSAVCLTILYNIPVVNGWSYQVTEDGCKGVLIGDEIVAAVATAATVYFQITLLALFLYPLLSRKTEKYRSSGNQNAAEDAASRAHASSVSNTEDNFTDGDCSASSVKVEKHKLAKKMPCDNPALENQTCTDGQTTCDCSNHHETPPYRIETELNHQSIVTVSADGGTNSAGEKSKSKSSDQKRPNIFSAPRLFKARSIFYRRNPKIKPVVPTKSPIANRSRDEILSSAAQRSETDHERDQKSSTGTHNMDRKIKQRRARQTQQGRRLMAYLKKSFFLMMICVVTDVVCTIVQAQVNVPEIVYLVMFDLNLLINLICIVMSFRDWYIILFPLCARRSKLSSFSIKGGTPTGSGRPDPAAAKRRADILRSVMPNGGNSPSVSSPRADAQSFSYDPLHRDKKFETPMSPKTSQEANETDINGET